MTVALWRPDLAELLAARPELTDIGLGPIVSMIGESA